MTERAAIYNGGGSEKTSGSMSKLVWEVIVVMAGFADICRWIYRLGLDRRADFTSRLSCTNAITPIDSLYKY